MKLTPTLKEAKRLYALGFAIHWLHKKSKRPIESGWTTGPRAEWDYLKETYIEGLNIGVRLGSASPIKTNFLAVIDVDIKSKTKTHRAEAIAALKQLLASACDGRDLSSFPEVRSGRGNGSRHIYCVTSEPFKTFNPAQSADIIKVFMPSKKPSREELEVLTPDEINNGLRLSHAWEISLYSNGRQVVLPPSIHPDSGEPYTWKVPLNGIDDLVLCEFESPEEYEAHKPKTKTVSGSSLPIKDVPKKKLTDFEVTPVDLGWLDISDSVREGIIHGTDVNDRSGYLMKAANALISAGLSQNEVLTVLTDPDTFLGACGYDHAKTKNRQRAAEWVYKYTLNKVQFERSAASVFTKLEGEPEEVELTGEALEKQNEYFSKQRNWRQNLSRSGQNGEGPPKPTIENVVLILKNIVGENIFVRDLFAYRDTYGCKAPWGPREGDVITDDDVALIRFWLGVNFNFEPKKEIIFDAITVIADENSFDPVLDLLTELPDWDGKERLNTWLVDHFEAQGTKDEGGREYLAQVFRKWMVAMIMRAYQPGAKFDWMPIFEGAQGVGKSSFGRLLVGERFFLDWLPNLGDKDSALALQGMWTVEMGELANLRKTEIETVKAYLTRTVDKVRPPYGRRMLESPRRCVFFGTTNRETYLVDESGNRRFKPVKVGNLDFKQLLADRAQLLAEAKHLFDNKIERPTTLEITGDAKIYEAKIHKEKMVSDESNAMLESLENFIEKWRKDEVQFDPQKFRLSELFEGSGGLAKWKFTNLNSQFAAKAIKKMGGEKRGIKGLIYWKIPDLAKNDDFY